MRGQSATTPGVGGRIKVSVLSDRCVCMCYPPLHMCIPLSSTPEPTELQLHTYVPLSSTQLTGDRAVPLSSTPEPTEHSYILISHYPPPSSQETCSTLILHTEHTVFIQVISLHVRSNLLEGPGVIVPEGGCAHLRQGDKTKELPYMVMLNRNLPDDIQVLGWADVPEDFSARFSCKNRTYKYFFPRANMDLDVS